MDNPRIFRISYWHECGKRATVFEIAVSWESAVKIANVPMDRVLYVRDMELPDCDYKNEKLVNMFHDAIMGK